MDFNKIKEMGLEYAEKGRNVAMDLAEKGKTQAKIVGAQTKLVAPKISVVGANGKLVDADGQLAGTPSVLFDAVLCLLSADESARLAKEASAIDWLRDAFGHLKAIGINDDARVLLKAAGIKPDAGVVDASRIADFIAAAKTRQWSREPKVRTLA